MSDHSGAWVALTDLSEVAVGWSLMYGVGDALGVVYRDTADAPWKLTVRIRTYLDDKVEGSQDRKRGFEVRGTPDDASRDELVAKAHRSFADFEAHFGGTLWRADIYGPAADFIRQLAARPEFHRRVVADGPERPQ